MKQSLRRMGSLVILAGALQACGADAPSSAEGAADLGLGARGDAVKAAHDYLERYGYFPNSELAAQFPSWRPIVPTAPADAAVFDEALQTAVRKFQLNFGLPASGVLDAATQHAMSQARCGHPDLDPEAEAGMRVDKYALYPVANRWTKTEIRFRFASPNTGLNGMSAATTRATITSAIKIWEQVTNLTFSEVSSGQDFNITYNTGDGPGNVLGSAASPPSPFLNIDPAEPWTTTNLTAVTLHEAGHLIGIDHSSFGSSLIGFAVMYPASTNRTTLDDDDRIAANVMYNGWQVLPGLGIDIGANSVVGSTGDIVWILGTDGSPFRWNGSSWVLSAGVTGTRIDVDNGGNPWVVLNDGRIFRGRPIVGAPFWTEVPGGGRALDVGIGQNGAAWIVGTDRRAWQFNASSNGWVFQGGPANQMAIDVDPLGVPWVLTTNNQIWVRGGSGWQQITSGHGKDIGLGGTQNGLDNRSYPWLIGMDNHVWAHDRQAGVTFTFPCGSTTCTTGAPAVDTWIQTNGVATRVTAGRRGRPWVINSARNIFTRLEMPF